MTPSNSRRTAHALVPHLRAALLGVLLTACGSGGGSGSDFSVRTTTRAASPSAPIVVAGKWLVYFASEAFNGPAGTPLNSDPDRIDQVAHVVNMRSREETNLGVAALGAAILGDEIYLLVDEDADGFDWTGDMMTDSVVLLHWSEATPVFSMVDFADAATRLIVAGGRLFYRSLGAPLPVSEETTLRFVEAVMPTTPQAVQAPVGGFARGSPIPVVRPLAQVAGLLFAAVDETGDGGDYNLDSDPDDATVLLLLDAAEPGARLVNTALALANDDQPLAARALSEHDWLVAFLVDEDAQGQTNLNDQNLMDSMGQPVFTQPLLPENCPASDVDAEDRVLHYLRFADVAAGLAAPVNTGISGHDRVLVSNGFVATISSEAEATCNLNAATGDTDVDDHVARWVATTLPVAPARSPEDLHALAIATAGGSMGLSVLNDRLVAVIDEAADESDFDTQVGETSADHDLVAWLDPAAGNPSWRFDHQSGSNPLTGTGIFDDDGDSEPFAGTSWMAPEAVGGRLPLVFLESVPGETNPDMGSLNINLDCDRVVKDNDKVDGLPVWADFESGPILDFDGMGYAVDLQNAGIVLAANHAFFRVSETADSRNYNGDADMGDVVLFRNPLTTCGPVGMATASLVVGPVIVTDGVTGAAFFSSESQADLDFNGDLDKTDLVVRYFQF